MTFCFACPTAKLLPDVVLEFVASHYRSCKLNSDALRAYGLGNKPFQVCVIELHIIT